MSCYIYLHSAMYRMRYNPGKIVTHGCKFTCKPDHLSHII